LRDTTRNRFDGKVLRLSKIFEWYGGDFKSLGGPEAFVRRELGLKKGGGAAYLEYDWGLNEARCPLP
jgi:hypothetical protein